MSLNASDPCCGSEETQKFQELHTHFLTERQHFFS